MIGQEGLIKFLDELIDNNKLPHFIILEGGRGSGRTEITKYIAKRIEAEFKVSEELKIANTREVIDDARTLSYKKLYLFPNMEGMNVQAENSLLKLVEEPTDMCYVVMTVESCSSLLPTILSRAKVFKMETYTKEQLRNFTNRDDLIEMCNTPGMIKLFESKDATDTIKFADKIVKNVGRVSVMNMLTILTYIDIDDKDEDKYNNVLILKAIENNIYKEMKSTADRKYLTILKKVQAVRRSILNASTNKQAMFDDLLFTMREVLRIES